MALEIRTKDKIFVAFVIPLLVAALYWWGWRENASKHLGHLQAENETLVLAEDFPVEYKKAEARLLQSERKLESAKLLKPADALLVPAKDSTFAEREAVVIDILRNSGLEILRVASSKRSNSQNEGQFSLATGYNGVLRRYTLSGTYPSVIRALKMLSSQRVAVIPEEVGMSITGVSTRWIIEVLL